MYSSFLRNQKTYYSRKRCLSTPLLPNNHISFPINSPLKKSPVAYLLKGFSFGLLICSTLARLLDTAVKQTKYLREQNLSGGPAGVSSRDRKTQFLTACWEVSCDARLADVRQTYEKNKWQINGLVCKVTKRLQDSHSAASE